MKYELVLDCDGVVADYEGEYRRLTGADPSEKGKLKAMRFRQMPHFYRNLPLLPDAMKLWAYAKPLNPVFLTAMSNFQMTSREDKEQWLHQHFGVSGKQVIIVAYPHDKYKHAAPNKILVDDNAKNCDEWVRAGGIAIHHKSVDDTIRRLKVLYGHSEATHVVETFQAIQDTPNVIEAFQSLPGRLETDCPNVVEALNILNQID